MAVRKVIVLCNNCDNKTVVKYDSTDDDVAVSWCPICGEDVDLLGSEVKDITDKKTGKNAGSS